MSPVVPDRGSSGRRRARRVAARSLAVLLAAAVFALAREGAGDASPGAWDLVVCADPHAMPLSDRSEAGYENAIAALLAAQMGARLVFDWYPQMQDMIDLRLRDGHCDVVMGVPDGTPPLLTTIAYYTSPYVFVYRADAGLELASLDDPVLADLDIGLQNAGMPPHDSLVSRGLAGNIVAEYGSTRYAPVEDPQARLVEAVLAGEVDVGVSWGPPAGYYAARHEGELVVVPIEPAIDPAPPFTPMQLPMTMGVRRGDEALRDALNAAIAARWDDIHAVLEEYSVPLVAGGPAPAPPSAPERRAVGFVAPAPSGALTSPRAAVYDVVGESARMGALLAEDDAARGPAPQLDVLFANSPSPEAAERAARRLVALDGAEAIVGGLGEGQAASLAAVAGELGIAFLNVADDDPALRCADAFNVAPGGAMYAAAVADWFGGDGVARWHVVRLEGPPWEGAAQAFRAAVASAGGEVVGETVVAEAQPLYLDALEAAERAGAEAVFLLVGAADQVAFLAQAVGSGLDLRVVPYPEEVTLSRDYVAAARRLGRGAGAERVAPWETTLAEGAAGELNERFTSRFGAPMDPLAWTSYAAVTLLAGAIGAGVDFGPDPLADFLLGGAFDLGKGEPLSFDPTTRQLLQPLYIARSAGEAEWGPNLGQRVAVAELAGTVPAPRADPATCRPGTQALLIQDD
ncbi:MAG TPA: quinoprotein dehydrogenase-associated putative ABC transporter substrate-binding protein [Trueperaceae bacterium]